MTEFSAQLKKLIIQLSPDRLILFCNLNCEKMLPGYEIFSKEEDWGDIAFFNDALKKIYDQLEDASKKINADKLYETLALNSPNPDDFDSISASYAFDVCCAFDAMVQYLLTQDEEHIVNNSQYCINSVDMFIQQKEGVDHTSFDDMQDLERLIAQDEYMKKEHNRQLTILAEIAKITVLNNGTIESLRDLNASFGPLIRYD